MISFDIVSHFPWSILSPSSPFLPSFSFSLLTTQPHLRHIISQKGNIILTNANYEILSLLRSHEYNAPGESNRDGDKEGAVKVAVKQVYPVSYATSILADGGSGGLLSMPPAEAGYWLSNEVGTRSLSEILPPNEEGDNKKKKKKNKKSSEGVGISNTSTPDPSISSHTLLSLLLKKSSGVSHYGPALLRHTISVAVATAGEELSSLYPPLDPTAKIPFLVEGDASSNTILPIPLIAALLSALAIVPPRLLSSTLKKSYILTKSVQDISITRDAFISFEPQLLVQHTDTTFITFASFSSAVDEYFNAMEAQRLEQKHSSAEVAALNKVDKVKQDQERRIQTLLFEQEELFDAAELVELHAANVDATITVINSALGSGMSWEDLNEYVSIEQNNGNPIACMINKINYEAFTVTLRLEREEYGDDEDNDSEDEEEEKEETIENIKKQKQRLVTVDLKISAYANAREMFSRLKAAKEKGLKTITNSKRAIKAATEASLKQLDEISTRRRKDDARAARKVNWFEKFNWMITADNYLVIAGKDAQQNEVIVKKYLRSGDAYLHADIHGAASCVVRAKRRRGEGVKSNQTFVQPISSRALTEAGSFTTCRSSAWASRIVTSAWWVEDSQVSKTAPTGEYLTVGSFMIRGRKNFLPASSLEMGIGILFRLGDDESIERHKGERRDLEIDENILQLKLVDGSNASSASRNSEAEKRDKQQQQKQNSGDNKKSGGRGKEEHVRPTEVIEREVSSRGKKSKLKKMKKYADKQDDEDRELAMLALQGNKEEGKDKKKRGGKKSNQNQARFNVKTSEVQSKANDLTTALLVKDPESVAKELLSEKVRKVMVEALGGEEGNIGWNKVDADCVENLAKLENDEEKIAAAERLLALANQQAIENYAACLNGVVRNIQKYGVKKSSSATEGGIEAPVNTLDDNLVPNEESDATLEKKQSISSVVAAVEDIDIDDEIEEEEEALDDTTELSKLTGKPTDEDIIMYAIPVCAPYHVLSQFKYRVKLTPGGMKKGKASKQCLDYFLKMVNTSEGNEAREADLIKSINENDWINNMLGDVKITSAGASKLQKAQRGQKKKGGGGQKSINRENTFNPKKSKKK